MCTDGEHCYEQGTVHTLVANRKFTQYSTEPLVHEYYLVTALTQQVEPIDEEKVANWVCLGNDAIIPEYITDPVLCHQIGNRLIDMYEQSGDDLLIQLKLRSCLYELLTLLTEYSVVQARRRYPDVSKSISPHTQRACRYINQNLAENFSVGDVAKATGITYSHLKTVFLRDMGMSIVAYRNLAKIRMVEQLLSLDNLKLEEAGEAVGIHDPAYLSRMFRKYTGMSVREYRRMKK